ncbi:MAG: response regulator [Faecousia sp.]
MYSVLLVDDEKIIREGVYELLSMADLDLDLTMAASAVEAISILSERRIDIALMDICMPQMSGLELYDLIRQRWPRCKMIFLTGHLEFDYVYKVHKHARYVLKVEDDSQIVEAVKESIEEIENALLLEQMTLDQSRHQHRSKYYERLLLMRELVDGSISSSCVTQEMVDGLGSNLDISHAVYCVMIRFAALRRMDYQQQTKAGESINLLVDKIFLENWHGIAFGYNKHLTYLLLQPKMEFTAAGAEKQLVGHAEMFQKAMAKNLQMPVSVFIAEHPVLFHQAIGDFTAISDQMAAMTEDEIKVGCIPGTAAQRNAIIPEDIQRELLRKVQQLEHQFSNMDRQGALAAIQEILEQVLGNQNMENLTILELYCTCCAKVIGYAKKIGFSEELAQHIGILNLYNTSVFHTWCEAFGNLKRVVEHIFEHVDTSIESKNEDVVNKVKDYIAQHLDGDTSLYALSGYVHFCPEHLLRVFKKQEGITILQYINDLKLANAVQMLSETEVPIKEIASGLGFTSAGYFGRFFKSKLGVSPNAYREQKGKVK